MFPKYILCARTAHAGRAYDLPCAEYACPRHLAARRLRISLSLRERGVRVSGIPSIPFSRSPCGVTYPFLSLDRDSERQHRRPSIHSLASRSLGNFPFNVPDSPISKIFPFAPCHQKLGDGASYLNFMISSARLDVAIADPQSLAIACFS